MKKIVLLVTGFCLYHVGTAQQRSHYTQYILNNYILNPALSGIENYTDIKLSARDQWSGFGGGPRTFYLTMHGPIGKKDYKTSPTSFAVPGDNPRGDAYWETYTASEAHHGVGMSIVNDKTGNFNRFSANLSYAYHLGLNAKTNLSAGFAAGISSIGLNADGKAFFGSVSTDPSIGGNFSKDLRKLKPDLSVGLWLYSADYFIGVSGQQVIPQKLSYADEASFKSKGRLIPHLFLTGGYRFLLNEDINAIPSVMIKYISNAFKNDYQVELNVKFQYRDLLWAGASYRQFDGYAGMIGFNIGNAFNAGYSYDLTTSDLRIYSRGTHELMIGFLIGNKYGDTCPRNVW